MSDTLTGIDGPRSSALSLGEIRNLGKKTYAEILRIIRSDDKIRKSASDGLVEPQFMAKALNLIFHSSHGEDFQKIVQARRPNSVSIFQAPDLLQLGRRNFSTTCYIATYLLHVRPFMTPGRVIEVARNPEDPHGRTAQQLHQSIVMAKELALPEDVVRQKFQSLGPDLCLRYFRGYAPEYIINERLADLGLTSSC